MGISVCRDSFRIANSGNLLAGCLFQDLGKFLPEFGEFVYALRRSFDFIFLPDEHLTMSTLQAHAQTAINHVRGRSNQLQPPVWHARQDSCALTSLNTQSIFVRGDGHRTESRAEQPFEGFDLLSS